jgi:hypothetical protein
VACRRHSSGMPHQQSITCRAATARRLTSSHTQPFRQHAPAVDHDPFFCTQLAWMGPPTCSRSRAAPPCPPARPPSCAKPRLFWWSGGRCGCQQGSQAALVGRAGIASGSARSQHGVVSGSTLGSLEVRGVQPAPAQTFLVHSQPFIIPPRLLAVAHPAHLLPTHRLPGVKQQPGGGGVGVGGGLLLCGAPCQLGLGPAIWQAPCSGLATLHPLPALAPTLPALCNNTLHPLCPAGARQLGRRLVHGSGGGSAARARRLVQVRLAGMAAAS